MRRASTKKSFFFFFKSSSLFISTCCYSRYIKQRKFRCIIIITLIVCTFFFFSPWTHMNPYTLWIMVYRYGWTCIALVFFTSPYIRQLCCKFRVWMDFVVNRYNDERLVHVYIYEAKKIKKSKKKKTCSTYTCVCNNTFSEGSWHSCHRVHFLISRLYIPIQLC